ncbi:MAG: UbiD family decarboxylase [Chloroflexota bacterium]|nr:MAG: UbiD family decarboxylase [Chloroflexota bacterium]
MRQDFRSYLDQHESAMPSDVKHFTQEVDPKYEITALMMQYEKMHYYPLLVFENIKGSTMPLVTNVIGSRQRIAAALGVGERQLVQEWRRRRAMRFEPKILNDAPFQENISVGDEIDLTRFPILTHFPIDGGPYITAGLVVAKDPVSGASAISYHRMQLKGKDKLGISLHSRRRIWEYQRRAEEMGKNLEVAVVIGNHPVLSLGSLALLPLNEGKFELLGGLFGGPLEIVRCRTVDLEVPAGAEIVIEGEILSGVREPEGPFGEFTGYASYRSTEHVFRAKAVLHRNNPIYQSICPGYCAEHNTVLAVHREGDLLEALQRALLDVRAVHVPHSGCGIFHAYISLHKTAEGQAQQAMFIAFGIDHGTKLAVVVDEDVDVFNESEVLWAMATRLQASKGVLIAPKALGILLDPSTGADGATDKMGIDATKPLASFASTLTFPEEVTESIKRLL